MTNKERPILRDCPAVCPVPFAHLWIWNILEMFSIVVELLEAIGITDKKRAFSIREDATGAGKFAISYAFLAPLLYVADIVVKVLHPLTLIWDSVFDGVDVTILGHRHPTDVVKPSLTAYAVAAPLLEEAPVSIEALHAMRVHIHDHNGVISQCVYAGDGIELTFADTLTTGYQQLFSIACIVCKTILVRKPKGVVGINGDWAWFEALDWNLGKNAPTLVNLCQYRPIGCVPKGAIGSRCNVANRLGQTLYRRVGLN